MTQGRGRPETTQLLRAKLGFRDDMLWKRFCARRLELIHSLSLSSRKASEQEEPVHFVARKLCNEYGYNPETVLPDFEKLVRAGIQSVRRNQRRFTRGINRDGKPVSTASSVMGGSQPDDSQAGSPSSPDAGESVTRPTGIVAALQELRSFLMPLMVSNLSTTMATPLIREGVFQLTVGATCSANGLDNFAPVLYESLLGELGDAMVRFFNVAQRKVLAPLLANAVVLHGIEVAFALQNVISELILAAGPDIAEMIEVLNRLEVPSALPPPRPYRRDRPRIEPPKSELNTSPQPDTPNSLQVSPVVDPTPANEPSTVASTPQVSIHQQGTDDAKPLQTIDNAQALGDVSQHNQYMVTLPPPTSLAQPGPSGLRGSLTSPLAGPVAGTSPGPSPAGTLASPTGTLASPTGSSTTLMQPGSSGTTLSQPTSGTVNAPRVEQDQLNAAATLATGFTSGIPVVQVPMQPGIAQQQPQMVQMVPMGGPAAQSTMLPSLQSLPIRGQWGSMPTMSERRVTIYYNGRHLSLIYSPLKNTPPTIAELIDHSRKTFTIAPDAVVRVRDLLGKRILETQQDLLDVFSQQIVDLELFLPPPMMSIAPPSNETPRFAPVAPMLVRSDPTQLP